MPEIYVIIGKLAYRLKNGELQLAHIFGLQMDMWLDIPAVAVRTPRQEAMLAHIKAALETAETSQL